MSTLVLCPSRERPGAARETYDSFVATRRDPGSRLVFIVDDDDPTRDRYPTRYLVPATGSMGGALRAAASDRSLLDDATSVGMIGDDCRFRTEGWDRILDGHLTESIGIAWPDDGWDHPWPSEEKAAHWWLSRPIVDALGVTPPTQHLFMDDYWAQLGWAAGCARYFPDVLVEHLHPLAGKGRQDPTYRRSRPFVTRDRKWYREWLTAGKAEDAARVAAIIGRPASPRLRVFADWHHPALWEALSILIEDRFGWDLYSPTGGEWKVRGWRLANGTPGWSAAAYLAPPGIEPEYPERRRRTVTWREFDARSWDIIIASVGVHQRSFADLARRKGARYVHHIGDVRRRLDPIDGQTVIASALREDADVVHHQEFDRALFAYAPIGDPHRVVSLMLRLEDTSGPYRWLAEAPGVSWSAVDCAAMRGPGYLAPMTAVAERIRGAGWVWHDKAGYRGAPPGDGYGHVLFTAAAMGRPLIGHASHYRGLLGERLWEDGETCIDLDRHSPEDALRRLLSLGPAEHEAMSLAIRARFDEAVDFDAEAEAIRAALA